ncbi:DUF2399 domain-containing protein [Bacillus sp. N9]
MPRFFAETEDGIHPLWKAAVETDSVLNAPVKLLNQVTRIWPAKGNIIWIVENSSVCSTIIDEVPDAPIICTHGQFRTASWIILEMLAKENCTFYYSGDLDPEGIAMAQRLIDRYPMRVKLWRMDKYSYKQVLSNEDVSTRLAKLELITDSELLEVVEMMRLRKKAGYQEGLVDQLVGDMKVGFFM